MGRRSCHKSSLLVFFLFHGLQQLVCLAQPAVDTSTIQPSASPPLTTQQKSPLVARVKNGPLAVSFETLNAPSAFTSSRLTFKILQLADLHFTGNPNYPCLDAPRNVNGEPCTEALMTTFIDDLLDLEKPDLVVFSGDNAGASTVADRQVAVDAFTERVEARKIPYAVILGNHDDENGFPRDEVLRLVMEKNYSYTERGPLTIDGVGNYRLSVQAPVDGPWGNATDNVFHMYFLDSGSHPNKTRHPEVVSTLYDWIHPSQVEYYMNLSREAQEESGTLRPLPAVMFFHIPLQEHAQGALEYWWRTGEMNEKVSSSSVPSTLFSTLVQRGEVKATFSGHDHINAYCYRRRGLQLCCAGGTGFGAAYGSEDFTRRARVIEWTVNSANERTITSWKRLYGRLDERYQEEVLFTERPRWLRYSQTVGKAKKVTERGVCQVKNAVKQRGMSAARIKNAYNLTASKRTVQCILQSTLHLKYPRERNRERTDWASVIFFDKKKFNLDGPDGHKYYWHDLREENESFFSRKNGGGSLAIWGAFLAKGKARLATLVGRQDFLSPTSKRSPRIYFRLGMCKRALFQTVPQTRHTRLCDEEAVPRLGGREDDLKTWRDVYDAGKQYHSVSEIEEALKAAWERITLETIDKIVKSIPDRCCDVLEKHGANTKH